MPTITVLKSSFDFNNAEVTELTAGISVCENLSRLSKNYQAGEDQSVVILYNEQELSPSEWALTIVGDDDRLIAFPRLEGELFVMFVIAVVVAVAVMSMIDIPVMQDAPEASPTYNLGSQGNAARLGAPIPDRYGRFRVYPAFAAAPYKEFEGNDQFLYQLFSIGHGSYEWEDLKIGDTPLANFEEITSVFYEAGQPVDLFPTNTYTAPEVNGLELFSPTEPEHTGPDGPFSASPSLTRSTEIAIDLTFPAGLHYANDDGGLSSRSGAVLFEYREIDDDGLPVGVWKTLLEKTYTNKTVDVLRFTEKVAVPIGRYEVRGERTNASSNSHRERDTINWSGLRSYLEGGTTYSHLTWAVKIRASSQLSSQSERKFNGVFTRKLPIYNGANWSAPTATRNPAWAFCNILKAEYGGTYGDNNLDLVKIKAIADDWEARGDYFDGQFDTKGTLWARLVQLCAAGRAKPLQYGEQFSMVRDDGKPSATYMFNGRNIRDKSLTIEYLTQDEWADDSIEIEYIDPVSWKPETIVCAVPASPATNPRKVRLFGVTDAKQAHREGMFLAAKIEYRNVVASFGTEMDGRVPSYLDGLIVVQDLINWGQGGEVDFVSGEYLILSEPVDFESGQTPLMYLRNDSGEAFGPYTVIEFPQQRGIVRIVEPLPEWIYTGNEKEKTYFAFQKGIEEKPRQMLLERVTVDGEYTCKLQAILDDPRVHQYDALVDDGTIPTPAPNAPKSAENLEIENVTIAHGGTISAPTILVSWNPASDALRYFVEVSFDDGASWERVYTGTSPQVLLSVVVGSVEVRIAAQNDEVGTWVQVSTDAGASFDTPDAISGFQVTGSFTEDFLDLEWNSSITAAAYFLEFLDKDGSVIKWQDTTTDIFYRLEYATAALNRLGREFDVKIYGVNGNNVRSQNATKITVKNPQSAELSGIDVFSMIGQGMVKWSPATNADHKGVAVWASTTQGFTPDDSTLLATEAGYAVYLFRIPDGETWYIKIAAYDIWGFDELTYSGEFAVTGDGVDLAAVNNALVELAGSLETLDGKFPITGTDIQSNAISTGHLSANSVSADKIVANSIGADKIVANSITSDEMAANSIGANEIKSNSITASEIASNAINTAELAADAVTANEIKAGEIDASHVKANSLTASEINVGSITANDMNTNGLQVKDGSGNVILGSGNALDWNSYVGGSGKPANNADVTSDNLLSAGANYFPLQYTVMDTTEDLYTYRCSLNNWYGLLGSTVNTFAGAYMTLAKSNTDYNQFIPTNRKWLIIANVYNSGNNKSGRFYMRSILEGTWHYKTFTFPAAGVWERKVIGVIDMTNDDSNKVLFRLDNDGDVGDTAFLSDIHVSPMVSDNDDIIPYQAPLMPKLFPANISTYIASLSVDTLQLAGQAVTIPTSSYVNGNYFLSTGNWETTHTLTHVGTGAPATLDLTWSTGSSGNNGSVTIQVYRGGTLIYSTEQWIPQQSEFGAAALLCTISVGIPATTNGSATYYMRQKNNGTSQVLVNRRSTALVETKK